MMKNEPWPGPLVQSTQESVQYQLLYLEKHDLQYTGAERF